MAPGLTSRVYSLRTRPRRVNRRPLSRRTICGVEHSVLLSRAGACSPPPWRARRPRPTPAASVHLRRRAPNTNCPRRSTPTSRPSSPRSCGRASIAPSICRALRIRSWCSCMETMRRAGALKARGQAVSTSTCNTPSPAPVRPASSSCRVTRGIRTWQSVSRPGATSSSPSTRIEA